MSYIIINDEEYETLFNQQYSLMIIYLAIKKYMNWDTCIAGEKRKISEQYLKEVLYLPSTRGHKREKITREEVRSGIRMLCKLGLLVDKKNCIFFLPKATRDHSIRKKHNQSTTTSTTISATRSTTKKIASNPLKIKDITKKAQPLAQPLAQPHESPKHNPPQYTNNISVLDITENTNRSGEIEGIVKGGKNSPLAPLKHNISFPPDFCITKAHVEYAYKHDLPNPHKHFQAFKEHHLAKGNRMRNWDMALYTWLRNAKRFDRQTQKQERDENQTKSIRQQQYDKFRCTFIKDGQRCEHQATKTIQGKAVVCHFHEDPKYDQM